MRNHRSLPVPGSALGVLACRSTTCDESFISVTIRNRCDALGAHMPTTCRTPGQGGINIEKGDKILVLDEAKLAKLIEKHRRALMAMPGPDDEPPTICNRLSNLRT